MTGNGEIIKEVSRILAEEEPIPQRVSQRLVMAGLVSLTSSVSTMDDRVKQNSEDLTLVKQRLGKIEDNLIDCNALTATVTQLKSEHDKITGGNTTSHNSNEDVNNKTKAATFLAEHKVSIIVAIITALSTIIVTLITTGVIH